MGEASIIERTRRAVAAPVASPAVAPLAVPAKTVHLPRWKRVDFCMREQVEPEWCWAATAVSIDWFFNHRSVLRQCMAANKVLGRHDCCDNPEGCDAPQSMKNVLTVLGHLREVAGVIPFAAIKAELSQGRPLCVHVVFPDMSGHFAVITGYREVAETLAIDDCFYGRSELAYTEFVQSYLHAGRWDHTYYLH